MPDLKFPYQAEWYQRNLEQNRRVRRENSRKYRSANPEKRLLAGARDRARDRGLDFNLDLADITIPDVCPILKVPMVLGTRYAPSLDRRDNNKGYVKGNVWVISRKANLMKNDATQEELKKFADWILGG